MNKEITIYELLGLIKDGQAPKKIKFNEDIYTYHDKEHGYCKHHYDNTYICINSEYYLFDILNDKVEIMEEDNKIEKLNYNYKEFEYDIVKLEYKNRTMMIGNVIIDFAKKIDELIDEVNKLKEVK